MIRTEGHIAAGNFMLTEIPSDVIGNQTATFRLWCSASAICVTAW